MRESAANTVLNQYLREKRKEGFYCYYELKVARGGTFNFKSIEDVQNESLPALANEGLVWKWSDEDSRRKPCDGASLPPLPSFLIIKFGGVYYLIEYRFIREMQENGAKSITEKQAYDLARFVVR